MIKMDQRLYLGIYSYRPKWVQNYLRSCNENTVSVFQEG